MQFRTLTIAAAILLGTTVLGHAQSPTSIGTFKRWTAYVSSDGEGKTCFIASQPQDSKYSQKISGRDDAFFMITSIPAKNIRNEASTIIGFPFQENSKVTVEIDQATFTMFTDKDSAWIETPEQEAALIEAMRKGTQMTVKGTSRRGTEATDLYSLSGVTAALEAIAKECGG
jgi:hypothetical protein